jgi:hypothetical protein
VLTKRCITHRTESTGWSKSLCAPYNYTVIVRWTDTFWSLYIPHHDFLTLIFYWYIIYFTPLSVTQGHRGSKSFIVVNNKLKKIWNEEAKAKFMVPSLNLSGRTDKNHTRVKTVGVSDQIRTEHLQDRLTNSKYLRPNQLTWSYPVAGTLKKQ